MMDLPSSISIENQEKISELFETMNDSPGKESDTLAMNWLKEHGSISGFVSNKWLPEAKQCKSYKISCCLTGKHFADVSPASIDTLNSTADNSREGLAAWSSLSASQRALCLRRISQNIERNAELLAQVECLSSTKHLHRTKSVDVPNLIQSFQYYANWADIREELPGWKETGVVCIVSEKNNPTLSMSLRISSILAGGNVVLLLVDKNSCFSSLLLADLCHLSGLPAGVLNVLPFEIADAKILPTVDKLIINGFRLKVNYIKMIADQGLPCEIFIPSKPVVMVYENADLHSACDGVLETLFFNDIVCEESCCKVYVQESIQKSFYKILEQKFLSILVGTNLTKTDMTCAVSKVQLEQIESTINTAREMQFKVIEGPCAVNSDVIHEENASSLHFKPILIFNVPTTSKLFDKIVGPVVITTPFRTVKESIAMFNCNKYSSQVSVWNERITVGLEVAQKLKARTVWLNSQNLFDASVVYGGIYRQGSSVEGGREGFFNHLDLKSNKEETSYMDKEENILYGTEVATADIPPSLLTENVIGHHIGGSYKKSERTRVVKNTTKVHAYVSNGSSADIHSAVASALGIQPKWESLSKYKKSQILLKAAETLNGKKEQFVTELHDLTGEEKSVCSKEVEESVALIRFWANRIDKQGGQLTETEYGKVLQDCNSIGVIGIQCPDQKPLLSVMTLAVSAIAFGNAVVVIPSEKYPVLALKMCEILYSSGLLGGVINVVNGSRAYLTRHLCLNLDVDSLWFSVDGARFINSSCITHPKKVFNCKDVWVDINDAKKLKLQFESTITKAIYMPVGSIFAN